MQHPGVHLEAQEYNHIKNAAMAVVQNELDAQYEPNSAYKVLLQRNGFQVSQRPVRDSSFKKLRSTGIIRDLTIEDIQYALYTEDSNAHRNFLAIQHGENYLEGAILNSTLAKNDRDPFLWFGVKYMKIYLPGKSAFEPRDATYVEYSGTTTNLRGERVLFVVRETHDFEEFPPIYEVVRFQFKVVQLYTQRHDGKITYAYSTYTDPNGSIPAWMYNKQAYSDMNMDEKLTPLLTMRRLLELERVKPRHDGLKNCVSCNSHFTVFRPKSTCSACGQNMCKKCRVTVLSPMHVKSLVPSEKRLFCKSCVIQTRHSFDDTSKRTFSSNRSFQDNSFERSESEPNVKLSDEWTTNSHGLSISSAPCSLETINSSIRSNSSVSSTHTVPEDVEFRRGSSFQDERDMRETFQQMKLSLDSQKQLLSDMQRQFSARNC
ncbi:hypothetical protein THRCLA_02759 [Thraustotheca clavata]|uniref:FYVE-type domain-containing protein n=1 Tax=Thraustotheca clavata TaxID=74557 RepID=A0A1W0A465_9STRA|nr:hypothetical protein THRCLA_02759 [Thraustotheca clavata]